MQRDWRDYNEDTQLGSLMKKLVVFVNQHLYDYINLKHMFCKILRLEKTPFQYKGVLTKNFLDTRISCKANKHLNLSQFDDEMKLTLFSFKFVKLEQRDYTYNDIEIDRDDRWGESTITLQDDDKRESFINEMKSDVKTLENIISNLEKILLQQCTLSDILIKEEEYQ